MTGAAPTHYTIEALFLTAFLAAVGIAATVPLAVAGLVFLFAWVVALLLAYVVGLPLYLLARRFGWVRRWTAALGGFVAGAALPAAALLPEAQSHDAWMPLSIVLLGMVGAASGLTFLLLVRWNLSSSAERISGIGIAGAAIALPCMTFWLASDRSCHNPLRNGAASIRQSASFHLDPSPSDPARLIAEVEAFGRRHGWSIRTERDDPRYPGWFKVSLCRESGTILEVVSSPYPHRGVEIGTFQPQGGDSWKAALAALHADLIRRRPQSIRYRDTRGALTPNPPEWLARTPPVAR